MCTEPRLPAPIASTRDSGSRRVWVQWPLGQVRLLLYPRSPASSPPRRSTPDHQWLAERAAAIATPAARPSCQRVRRLTSRTGGARRRRRRPQRRTLWTRSGWAPSIGSPSSSSGYVHPRLEINHPFQPSRTYGLNQHTHACMWIAKSNRISKSRNRHEFGQTRSR